MFNKIKEQWWVLLVAIIFIVGILFLVNIYYGNQYIALKNQIVAQQTTNTTSFDKMIKVIGQKVQVSDRFADRFNIKNYDGDYEGILISCPLCDRYYTTQCTACPFERFAKYGHTGCYEFLKKNGFKGKCACLSIYAVWMYGTKQEFKKELAQINKIIRDKIVWVESEKGKPDEKQPNSRRR